MGSESKQSREVKFDQMIFAGAIAHCTASRAEDAHGPDLNFKWIESSAEEKKKI